MKNMTVRKSLLGVIVGACLWAQGSGAAALASFEAAVSSSSSDNGDSSLDGCLFNPLLIDATSRIFFGGIFYGGAFSVLRLNPDAADYVEMPGFTTRQWGEGLIPYVRTDAAYHWVESDVYARDFSMEAGFGPMAFRFNRTGYEEDHPDDDLTVTRLYGVYRMSFGAGWEVDVGVGTFSVEGDDENDSLSVTVPVLYHPLPGSGFEFRPTWSDNVQEYDFSVLGGWRFLSVKAGYHWMQSEGESLKGPYVGLSVHF